MGQKVFEHSKNWNRNTYEAANENRELKDIPCLKFIREIYEHCESSVRMPAMPGF
jgi:hypothetical protein